MQLFLFDWTFQLLSTFESSMIDRDGSEVFTNFALHLDSQLTKLQSKQEHFCSLGKVAEAVLNSMSVTDGDPKTTDTVIAKLDSFFEVFRMLSSNELSLLAATSSKEKQRIILSWSQTHSRKLLKRVGKSQGRDDP